MNELQREMRKIQRDAARKVMIPAHTVHAGTIIRPFIGDDRFDVMAVETTPQGSTIFRDTVRDLKVEMDKDNRVEVLGYFNLDDDDK